MSENQVHCAYHFVICTHGKVGINAFADYTIGAIAFLLLVLPYVPTLQKYLPPLHKL